MKIFIAGGAGYIGSRLTPRLLELGHTVDVADLLWFGNNLPKEVPIIKKDLFQLHETELQDYDAVIFLAGLSNDPMAEFSPSKNFVYNAALPAYLAYIAKNAGVKRFIYAGSCSVYGYTKEKLFNEDDPTISNYPYGISKLQGEKAVMQLKDEHFSVICLRQGTVCGYSPRMRLDLVVNTMFKSAIINRKITVNNPSIWRPVLGIKDACHAYISSINASLSTSGIFNVASGNFSVGDLATITKKVIDKNMNLNIEIDVLNTPDMRNYKVSTERAQKMIGFDPDQNIGSILLDLQENLPKFKDFDKDEYYNINVFKRLLSDISTEFNKS